MLCPRIPSTCLLGPKLSLSVLDPKLSLPKPSLRLAGGLAVSRAIGIRTTVGDGSQPTRRRLHQLPGLLLHRPRAGLLSHP